MANSVIKKSFHSYKTTYSFPTLEANTVTRIAVPWSYPSPDIVSIIDGINGEFMGVCNFWISGDNLILLVYVPRGRSAGNATIKGLC